MPDDRGGHHAELAQEPRIGDRQRDKDGLDNADFVKPVTVVARIGLQLRDDRTIDMRGSRPITFRERRAKRRMTAHQLTSHASPLRALSGTDKGNFRSGFIEDGGALTSPSSAKPRKPLNQRRRALRQRTWRDGTARFVGEPRSSRYRRALARTADSSLSAISVASRRKARGLRAERGNRTAGAQDSKGSPS